MTVEQKIITYVLAVIVGGLGLTIVGLVLLGKIKLDEIFQEEIGENKKATSLAKFQFLIFTFVIGLSLFLVTLNQNAFPTIHASILALLGISAGTAVVSKGITSAQRVRLGEFDKAVRLKQIEKEVIQTLAERDTAALREYLERRDDVDPMRVF